MLKIGYLWIAVQQCLVVLGQCDVYNGCLWANEPRLRLKRFRHPAGMKLGISIGLNRIGDQIVSEKGCDRKT